MSLEAVKDPLASIKLHAEQHEVIRDSDFRTPEEYVLHLMHRADYERAAALAQDGTVLDLGCNGGHGTSILSRTCREVIGVDVSPAAVASANAKHASEKASFRVVDGVSLPFPDHSFDLVTSFQVIEHLDDPQSYLIEIQRVLKPGGLVLVTTPNAAIRVHPGQKPWNPFHVREFRASELEDLLRRRFAFTLVFGQFASERTYAIEYNRCISARGNPPRPLVERAVRKLWRLVARAQQVLRNRAGPDAPSPVDFRAVHSIGDFYYKGSELDASLSLVACCSASEITATRAARAFLGDR